MKIANKSHNDIQLTNSIVQGVRGVNDDVYENIDERFKKIWEDLEDRFDTVYETISDVSQHLEDTNELLREFMQAIRDHFPDDTVLSDIEDRMYSNLI